MNNLERAAIFFMAIALISTLYACNRIFFIDLMVFIVCISAGIIKHLFWAFMVAWSTLKVCDAIRSLRKD